MGKKWDKLEGANYASVKDGNGFPKARNHSVNYLGSPNPTCRTCGGLRSLNSEGSGGRTKCKCEEPDFPNYRTPAMQAQQQWHVEWLDEAYRVLQPGGVVKAFSGTRTFHRLAAAMESAGFTDIRLEAWVYGSGFPKSLDVSKAIDATTLHGGSHSTQIKKAISDRPGEGRETATLPNNGIASEDRRGGNTNDNAATEAARQWEGWGTALKPSWEPVLVGWKPACG